MRFVLPLLAVLAYQAAGRAEIIDRVLAVVGGEIITLSDARAVERLGLIVPDRDRDDPLAAVLTQLVDRRLMLAEIERYGPPDPSPAAIEAALAAVRSRFADALAFEAALNGTVMSHETLRRYVSDTLRIEAYLQQRFGDVAQPSDDELLRYYHAHLEAFRDGAAVPPFDTVREEVRARVVEERRTVLVEGWMDGLRRRGNVVVLYLPAAATPAGPG